MTASTSPILPVVTLHSPQLGVALCPHRGGRIISLRDRRSGREWLLQEDHESRNVASPGEVYGAPQARGFDECFPTIAPVTASGDARIRPAWPDHGELWSRPWRVEHRPAGLWMGVEGAQWPYRFGRLAGVEGDVLRLDYELENLAPRTLDCLWSAHPLLQAAPGTVILLPTEAREARVDWSSSPELGVAGELRPWPHLGTERDFSRVQDRDLGLAVKLHVTGLSTGWAGVWDPLTGEALTFAWDPMQLAHLGLWLCYGGWPREGGAPQHCVALEPCSGMPDSVVEAARRGTCVNLGPGERITWQLRIRAHTGCTSPPTHGEAP